MMVFYRGGGTWYYGRDNFLFIDLAVSGLFYLPNDNQKEIKYKGQTRTVTLLPILEHKDGANPLVNWAEHIANNDKKRLNESYNRVTELFKKNDLNCSKLFLQVSDENNLNLGVLFTKDNVIPEVESKTKSKKDNGYQERNDDFEKWVKENPGLDLDFMTWPEIHTTLITRNSSLWISGFADWIKQQKFHRGKPGRKKRVNT